MRENIYVKRGYKNREDYLEYLSMEYNVDLIAVKELAYLLGESEDWDGLVNMLQDIGNDQALKRKK